MSEKQRKHQMAAAPRREIRVDREMMEPLSHHTDAVLCGDFLYLSGAAPLDTAANVIAPGDLVKQCEATCHNTDLMLQAADMSFKDIAHFKILMEDVIYWPLIEPVCRSYLGEVRPSSTRVGMGHPAVPGMLLEIKATAVVGGGCKTGDRRDRRSAAKTCMTRSVTTSM